MKLAYLIRQMKGTQNRSQKLIMWIAGNPYYFSGHTVYETRDIGQCNDLLASQTSKTFIKQSSPPLVIEFSTLFQSLTLSTFISTSVPLATLLPLRALPPILCHPPPSPTFPLSEISITLYGTFKSIKKWLQPQPTVLFKKAPCFFKSHLVFVSPSINYSWWKAIFLYI